MSEQRDSEVLFPWEIEGGGTGSDTEAAAETDAKNATDAAPSESTASEADASIFDAEAGAGIDAEAPEAGPGTGEGTGVDREGELPETDAGAGVDARAAADEAADADLQGPPGNDASAAGADEAGGAPDAGNEDDHDDEDRFAVLDSDIARQAAERASAALRDRPVAPKEYYSISEVCDLVGLKPHVLRYWETQFQVLNPSKNRSGNRVYQRKEIRLIMLVKHLLYEEKYTVEGAKAKLDQLRRGGELADVTGVVLDRAMIEQLRADLSELTTLLTPPTQV